ncbi:methyl-accepting chemotaxis protein [Phaeobacter sp. 11ANDIMAR09]|uniref:methyl-accepting chemotaxis protein n=1 Tax=Phaeobacter sp. 11ANDIMAR09 TaxID=1225647 RepID=UPI0006C881A5|nr:methyl-accepting chemotaxis protein [Phaeobacter sp. 11ANDIMAR09]KPD11624.1 diguanylate cyclase [Phaeobacter sp. 11ANDIMAR09]
MKISVNFIFLFIILMAGAIMFGLAGISYYTHEVRDELEEDVLVIEHIYQSLDKMEIEFLMARRFEKDFLLRMDPKYIDRHASAMQHLYDTEHSLEEEMPLLDSMRDQIEPLRALMAAAKSYDQSFATLVDSHNTLGLDEKSGLQGALRSAVHGIEERLSEMGNAEMTVKMLMMRRHEKDFIMRKNTKYLDRLNARVDEFLAFPDSYYNSADQRSEIESLLQTYQTAFASYVKVSMEETALRKDLSARYAEAEPILIDIHKAAAARLADIVEATHVASADAKYYSLLTSAIGTAVFLVLAFLLARSIARPLSKLESVLQGIVDHDFSEEPPKSRLGEIASISSAVAVFRQGEMKKDQLTQDISEVISACAEGDFTRRIATDDSDGTFAELGKGVNSIGEAAQKGLGDVLTALAALSEGDLTKRMPEGQKGIFKEISDATENLNNSLGSLVGQLTNSSDLLKNTSNEIAAAADDASQRSERTSASIVETAGALQTLGETVKGTADSSQQARKIVSGAQDRARETQEIAQQTNQAMKRIEASSGAIAKIISMIEDVAFQTSLLALNAGVEAARAGEAGRGFAVVASEVRSLAHRSAEAAQEINDLISTSEKEVAEGVKLVGQTGASLEEILTMVEEVVTKVNEIADTTVEQSKSINQVNGRVDAMDSDAQQNAAMLEETAASGQMLRDEASNLVQIVSKFELPTKLPETGDFADQDAPFQEDALYGDDTWAA